MSSRGSQHPTPAKRHTARLVVPHELVSHLRADPALRRADRIGIGLSMHEDGFSSRDIARVASLRWSTVVEMRRLLGLPQRPRGAAATNVYTPDLYPAPRSLVTAVAVLARTDDIWAASRRLCIGEMTAYGIRRAIQYALALQEDPEAPPQFRCPECEQRGPQHPCAHCGHEWLQDAA